MFKLGNHQSRELSGSFGGRNRTALTAIVILVAVSLFAPAAAGALASYARQTGLSCATCHFTFPELTPTGRDFKLHGYTKSAEEKTLTEEGTPRGAGLAVLDDPPLSLNLQTSITVTNKPQSGSEWFIVEFPQQVNLLLAGKIASNVGSFVQLTYTEAADTISGDSSDVRYASDTLQLGGRNFVWGLDVNNFPTFEDLWNSAPAWGFQFASADTAGFSPGAATMIDGTLAHQVVGAGLYAMWDNRIYATAEGYRSQHLGVPQPETGAGKPINIQWAAPYWRVAWQENIGDNNYFELGTYGIYVQTVAGAVGGSPVDSYLDLAGDASYVLKLQSGDAIIVHATFIHESTDLAASVASSLASQASDDLNSLRLDAAYHLGNLFTLTVGPFMTWGTSDALRYATGFSGGSPNNNGVTVQAALWPWQNLEVGAQYKYYFTYNGAAINYDGSGRNASDDGTFYAFIWLNY